MTSSFSNMVIAGQALGYLDDLDSYGAIVEQLARAAESAAAARRGCSREAGEERLPPGVFPGLRRAGGDSGGVGVEGAGADGGPDLYDVAVLSWDCGTGRLSFIDRETLVVAYLASDEQIRPYETDLLGELQQKELGATIAVTGFALTDEALKAAQVTLDLGR